jgi:RNA polymerase sigma-70 factor (ECF subfamily)
MTQAPDQEPAAPRDGNTPPQTDEAWQAGPVTPASGEGPSDQELVGAARGGDLAAFEVLMCRHGPRVFRTVRRYLRRESDAEDLAQEIWIKAFQKLSGYRGDAPFEHWLMRLAVRTCYDALRAGRRNREASFTDLSEVEQQWLLDQVHHAADPDPSRAEAARHLVEKLMEQLNPADRLVLTLLELEDRSVKEVAALTGWSVATVKVRAFRARSKMRRLLARWLEEHSNDAL